MTRLLCMTAALAATATAPPAAAQDTASSPDARKQMRAYGACVADASRAKTAQTLSADFRTRQYHAAMRALNSNNLDCSRILPRRSKMRSNGLLFAGALAERLLAADPKPLNVRLAQAAMRPAPATYSRTDAIAMCVVRSAPDDSARLFKSEVASDAEAEAAKALGVAVRLCARGGPALEANVEGLRAMLATAAFRNVAALAPAGKK